MPYRSQLPGVQGRVETGKQKMLPRSILKLDDFNLPMARGLLSHNLKRTRIQVQEKNSPNRGKSKCQGPEEESSLSRLWKRKVTDGVSKRKGLQINSKRLDHA